MLSDYIIDQRSLDRLHKGAAGAFLNDYTGWLADDGYAKSTIVSYLFAADRFLTWVQQQGADIAAMARASTMSNYRLYLAKGKSSGYCDGGNSYCGARRLQLFLRTRGIIPEKGDPDPPLLLDFGSWIQSNRGIADTTLESYSRPLRHFLLQMGDHPEQYTAAQLRSFVLSKSQGYSHSHAESVVTAIRMFVRFLISTGRCSSALENAIPRIAKWRKADLPNYIDPKQIEEIIAGCDQSTDIGVRDRTILLLLARLALRASDIAGMSLQDIDWDNGCLIVSGKTRQEALLPLPQDVGDALIHYLEMVRPQVSHRAVFCLSNAPFTPVKGHTVSHLVGRCIRRAGVSAPSHGAHIFRHSAATSLLRQGLSLESIATLLRHQDISTTSIYAKVDTGLLQQVTLPWLEEELPC